MTFINKRNYENIYALPDMPTCMCYNIFFQVRRISKTTTLPHKPRRSEKYVHSRSLISAFVFSIWMNLLPQIQALPPVFEQGV